MKNILNLFKKNNSFSIILKYIYKMFTRKRILIKKIFENTSQYLDKSISVCGWIENFRVQKNNGIAFISLTFQGKL